MARGRRIVAFVVVATFWAAAVDGQGQSANGPSSLQDSECFSCHEQGGGSFGPPLRAMFAVIPPDNFSLEAGEPKAYRVEIVNRWTAELRDITATLDIGPAPNIGFSSDAEPLHIEVPATITGFSTGDRTDRQTIDVPGGITDLRIVIDPVQGGPIAPDLILRVWSASADPEGSPGFEIDSGGNGDRERLQIKGGDNLARLGAGTWTIEAAQRSTDAPASLISQGYTLRVDAWSNTTGERRQTQSVPGILDGQAPESPQNASVPFVLLAEDGARSGDRILLTVNATAYYDHPGTTSGGIDDWIITKTIEVGLMETVTDEDPVIFDPDPAPPEPVDEIVIPWDRIGEIVGYVSAFLLVFSMLTGGVFGKSNRRILNKWFKGARRRIAFHNFVSYLLTFWAVVHTVLFIVEPGFPWTLGIIWGGVALLAMFLLGVTGAFQVPMVRRWSYGTWRWTHLALAIAALVFTVVHLLLDGANFTEVAEAVGWQDPFQ